MAAMATVRLNLQRDVFQDYEGERLIGLVNVTKPSSSSSSAAKKNKKQQQQGKMIFLCIVHDIHKRTHSICQVKRSDDIFKKHTSWPLTELRMVDGKTSPTATKETAEFELHFGSTGKPYKWVASSFQDKYTFISLLYKCCCQTMPLNPPQFINLPKDLLTSGADIDLNVSGSGLTMGTDGASYSHLKEPINRQHPGEPSEPETPPDPYEVLTPREEADLERLMSANDFSIHNAEAFTEQLAREVQTMDAQNIHHIMAVEQRMQGLLGMLQNSIDEAFKLEQRLEHYETLLKNVRDVVFQVEQKESRLQVQSENQKKLLHELEALVSQLDFDRDYENILLEEPFKSKESLLKISHATKALEEALNAEVDPMLCYLLGVQEQRQNLERIKKSFSQRFFSHIHNLLNHFLNEFGPNLLDTIEAGREITLPSHEVIHQGLLPYSGLSKWMKNNDPETFQSLRKMYVSKVRSMYDAEFQRFFEAGHEKISGGRFTISSTGSGGHGSTRRSSGMITSISAHDAISSSSGMSSSSRLRSGSVNPSLHLTENVPLDSQSQKSSEFSMSEWEEFDSAIERILSAIDPVIISEQKFCAQFFAIDRPDQTPSQTGNESTMSPSSPSSATSAAIRSQSVSPSPSNLSQASSSVTSEQQAQRGAEQNIRALLTDIFNPGFENEFLKFANSYDKMDGIYSMYLLVRMTQHVLSACDSGSFLTKTYGSISIHIKRNFDRFMQMQLSVIEEAKAPKKPKCGILPFIKNFETFAKQAEVVFKAPCERRSDIDRWYTVLMRAIFEAIKRVSLEHPKTPAEMIRIENYHYLHDALSQLKIPCLEAERKEAKQRYQEAVQEYVARYFGRPLEKLNVFFEGVQAKMNQGVREEEISYQLAFSKQELRKVINECSLKSVKKGLEEMYRKVEKHVSEPDRFLIQVIWRSMQEEFISQYNFLQEMIERCYPGANIALSLTIEDVLGVFSDIAYSH